MDLLGEIKELREMILADRRRIVTLEQENQLKCKHIHLHVHSSTLDAAHSDRRDISSDPVSTPQIIQPSTEEQEASPVDTIQTTSNVIHLYVHSSTLDAAHSDRRDISSDPVSTPQIIQPSTDEQINSPPSVPENSYWQRINEAFWQECSIKNLCDERLHIFFVLSLVFVAVVSYFLEKKTLGPTHQLRPKLLPSTTIQQFWSSTNRIWSNSKGKPSNRSRIVFVSIAAVCLFSFAVFHIFAQNNAYITDDSWSTINNLFVSSILETLSYGCRHSFEWAVIYVAFNAFFLLGSIWYVSFLATFALSSVSVWFCAMMYWVSLGNEP